MGFNFASNTFLCTIQAFGGSVWCGCQGASLYAWKLPQPSHLTCHAYLCEKDPTQVETFTFYRTWNPFNSCY